MNQTYTSVVFVFDVLEQVGKSYMYTSCELWPTNSFEGKGNYQNSFKWQSDVILMHSRKYNKQTIISPFINSNV